MGSREGIGRNTEKSFFFCVDRWLAQTIFITILDLGCYRVVYMRMGRAGPLEGETEKPVHQLVVHGARVAWTQSNRDMWFALYESWRRAQILRKNVSSDALKLVHGSNCKERRRATPALPSRPHHHLTSSKVRLSRITAEAPALE